MQTQSQCDSSQCDAELIQGDDEILSSSSQLPLSSDINISDDESDGINSLPLINRDEELDTSGEAEAQSIVRNATITEGCIAAIAETLRQHHTSELPPETCANIGDLLAPTKSIGEKYQALNSLSIPEK